MDFLEDLRHAFRVSLKTPGVTFIAVLSIALGIGANSAVFSVIDALFLRPLPVERPEEIVRVWAQLDGRWTGFSFQESEDLRRQMDTFSGIAAFSRRGALLDTREESRLIGLTVVNDDYFSVLGIRAAQGRVFPRQMDQNPGPEPAVVISHALAEREFGSEQAAGRPIRLNGRAYTVAGVLPPSFRGLQMGVPNDVWAPTSTWKAMHGAAELERRDIRVFEVIGRLRPGVTLEQARAQVRTVTARLAAAYPETNQRVTMMAVSEQEQMRGRANFGRLLLLGVIALVLGIACANAATLLLARNEARAREFGVRLALGASRRRLVRQLLAEAAWLGAAAAALGGLLAVWLIDLIAKLVPPGPNPFDFGIRLDARVLLFTLALSAASILLSGLAPALHSSKPDLVPLLKLQEGGLARKRGGFARRSVLVAGQIALSVVLLTGSGLFLRSFLYTVRIRPGFDTGRDMLLVLAAGRGSLDEWAAALKALPGVRKVSYARRLDLSGSGGGATREVTFLDTGSTVALPFNQVAGNFFETMGTRILRGRPIDSRDTASAPPVVVVNQSLALRYFPDQDPIGRWLNIEGRRHQIVGIAEDAPIAHIRSAPEPVVLFPFAQLPSGEFTLLIETSVPPEGLADSVRRLLRSGGSTLKILSLTTLEGHMKAALYPAWLPTVLSGGLAVLGLALATVGLYGAVSYAAFQRRREFGLRLALGAHPRDVMRLVFARALALAAAGVVAGVAAALASTRLIAGLLYGVRLHDPLTYAAVCAFAVLVTLAASALPARRVSQLDPMSVLRCE